MDFNEQSPTDYTLIVSDIPKEKNVGTELKNNYLDVNEVNIKEINLTYKLTDQIELKNKIRNIQKNKQR